MYENLSIKERYLPYQLVSRISEPSTVLLTFKLKKGSENLTKIRKVHFLRMPLLLGGGAFQDMHSLISEIILVHRFDRIDLARIFVYTYILHIYIIPKKNNKKLKKNLCFLLVIYVFCFLFVKK